MKNRDESSQHEMIAFSYNREDRGHITVNNYRVRSTFATLVPISRTDQHDCLVATRSYTVRAEIGGRKIYITSHNLIVDLHKIKWKD